MALVVYGGGITKVVGSHAGNTFTSNKGGAVMKRKPHGTNPSTTRQTQQRSLISQLAKSWTSALTDGQRANWRAYAATFPVVNKLGNTTFLSGNQLFSKLNIPVVTAGNAIPVSPPISSVVNSPIAVTIAAASGGGGSLTVNVTSTGTASGEAVIIWVAPPLSLGKNFVSSQLRQLPGNIVYGSTVDITSKYLQLFGALPSGPGQRIFMRIFIQNITNGITSTALQGSSIWT